MTKTLPLYTFIHFAVDLTCIFKLFSTVRPQTGSYEKWLAMVVLYNFLAFALPAFEGLAADLIRADLYVAAAGCALVGAAALISFPTLPVVILAGVGNGLFHIGAGRRVLVLADGKYSPPGIFISSGALGVFLGMSFAEQILHPLDYALAAVMFAAAVIFIVLDTAKGVRSRLEKQPDFAASDRSAPSIRFLTPAVFMILFVVFLRSYYGTAVSYSWKNTFGISLIFTLCVVAGKALGGITADRIGIWKTSLFSLAAAAVTVLFSADLPFFGCISILLFNMTMPLTLTLLAQCWKPYPGMAFGVLMLALFAGTLPDAVFHSPKLPIPGLCIACIVSLVFMLAAIRFGRKHGIDAA